MAKYNLDLDEEGTSTKKPEEMVEDIPVLKKLPQLTNQFQEAILTFKDANGQSYTRTITDISGAEFYLWVDQNLPYKAWSNPEISGISREEMINRFKSKSNRVKKFDQIVNLTKSRWLFGKGEQLVPEEQRWN